jgi:hypothetical protein
MFKFKLHVSLADDPKVAGFLPGCVKIQASSADEALELATRSPAYIQACYDLGSTYVILYDAKQVIFVIPKERAAKSVFITSLVQV